MSRIEKEIELLLETASAGELPGYPETGDNTCFSGSISARLPGLNEYFSGENDAVEKNLRALWKNDEQKLKLIPIIIAAIEKSRQQTEHMLAPSELYNYTM